MAEEGNIVSDTLKANGEDTAPAVGMLSQYIKDLSVENPNAPNSYPLLWDAPRHDYVQWAGFSPNAGPGALGRNSGEVIGVFGRVDVELEYATLFGLRNVDEGYAHQFLFGEAPRLMFPFARRVVADAIRDAGYPPLVLDPIDFNGLYLQQLAQAQATAEAQPAGEA